MRRTLRKIDVFSQFSIVSAIGKVRQEKNESFNWVFFSRALNLQFGSGSKEPSPFYRKIRMKIEVKILFGIFVSFQSVRNSQPEPKTTIFTTNLLPEAQGFQLKPSKKKSTLNSLNSVTFVIEVKQFKRLISIIRSIRSLIEDQNVFPVNWFVLQGKFATGT